jgi:hypothetical protein
VRYYITAGEAFAFYNRTLSKWEWHEENITLCDDMDDVKHARQKLGGGGRLHEFGNVTHDNEIWPFSYWLDGCYEADLYMFTKLESGKRVYLGADGDFVSSIHESRLITSKRIAVIEAINNSCEIVTLSKKNALSFEKDVIK